MLLCIYVMLIILIVKFSTYELQFSLFSIYLCAEKHVSELELFSEEISFNKFSFGSHLEFVSL